MLEDDTQKEPEESIQTEVLTAFLDADEEHSKQMLEEQQEILLTEAVSEQIREWMAELTTALNVMGQKLSLIEDERNSIAAIQRQAKGLPSEDWQEDEYAPKDEPISLFKNSTIPMNMEQIKEIFGTLPPEQAEHVLRQMFQSISDFTPEHEEQLFDVLASVQQLTTDEQRRVAREELKTTLAALKQMDPSIFEQAIVQTIGVSNEQVVEANDTNTTSVNDSQTTRPASASSNQPDIYNIRIMQEIQGLSRGQQEAVMPLLTQMMQLTRTEGLQNLIETLSHVLDSLDKQTTPFLWATLLNSRSAAYQQNPNNNFRQNIQAALDDCRESLTIFTREATPSMWVQTMHLRGILEMQNPIDDPQVHKEEALATFALALTAPLPHTSQVWIQLQGTYGFALLENKQKNPQENTQQSLEAFDAVIDAITQTQMPEQWSLAKMGRSAACLQLFQLTGDRRYGFEQIINDCNDALTFFTREQHPQQWSHVLQTRAVAYVERTAGEQRRYDIEQALADCTNALTVLSRRDTPKEWAEACAIRGNVYFNRVMGERPKNLELAIADYNSALTFFTQTAHPDIWSQVMTSHSMAQQELGGNDRSQNTEQVIADCKAALAALSPEKTPIAWGRVHVNWGNIYLFRLANNRQQNFREAEYHYNEALKVFTQERSPLLWAQTLVNRGIVKRSLMHGEKILTAYTSSGGYMNLFNTENFHDITQDINGFLEGIDDAIADFEAALTVLTLENAPREWAVAQRELATTYGMYTYGNRKESIVKSLAAYDAALKVTHRQNAPYDWAIIHYNRGLLFTMHVLEDQQKDAQRALADFDAALTVFKPEVAPANYRRLQVSRSYMLERLGLWEEAHLALAQARKVQRDLVAAAMSDSSRTDVIREFTLADLYLRDVQVLLRFDPPNIEEAVIALEEGRAQSMRAAFDLDSIDPKSISNPTVKERAEAFLKARNAWRAQQHKMIAPVPAEVDANTQATLQRKQMDELQSVYTAFLKARDAIRQHDNPDFMTPVPTLKNIANAVGEPGEALIYLSTGTFFSIGMDANAGKELTDGGESGMAVIVTRDILGIPQLQHIKLPKFTPNALSSLLGTHGKEQFPVKLERLQALAGFGLNELATHLYTNGVRKVTLVTYGHLSLFPLAAVQVRVADGMTRYMGDLFEMTFAPSARASEIARTRAQTFFKERDMLLIAGNPRPLIPTFNDLPYASAEADTIGRIAKAHGRSDAKIKILIENEVTKQKVVQNIQRVRDAHIAVHGEYRVEAPLTSRLILAGVQGTPEEERTITLSEVLAGTTLNLQGLRLLVLSACQTSVVDVQNMPNEVIGLAAGFLQAGVAGVIASLWLVNDIATYLLMSRFAQLYLDTQGTWSPARALAAAQHWLREEATYNILVNYDPLQHVSMMEEGGLRGTNGETRYRHRIALGYIKDKYRQKAEETPDGLPFANAEYWAAFFVTGC